MNVLLIRPRPEADLFGLAPFFQIEPLGIEYIAAELEFRGHRTTVIDMRFERRKIPALLKKYRPHVVGIACLHIIDVSATLGISAEIFSLDSAIFIAVGGHAASVFPQVFSSSKAIKAVCIGEGEMIFPGLVDTLAEKKNIEDMPSILLNCGKEGFKLTSNKNEPQDLAFARLPARGKIARYQKHYCCLNYMPVWALETTRGCHYQCKFCSVWQFYQRSCRYHTIDNVREDFSAAGHNIFIVDDIFWAESDRSSELSRFLIKNDARKNWILVQSRCDHVVENYELLESWRHLARSFDIFFGFESPTSSGLNSLNKDSDIHETEEAIKVARRLGFGVTGSMIIDPAFEEEDFQLIWDFLDKHKLYRVGFTILTPLPGTYFFDEKKDDIMVFDWNQYDMHHLLWKPRLPLKRFWELYCETWRRTVLNLSGSKKWWNWCGTVNPLRIPRLAHILYRTQKLMNPKAYMNDSQISEARYH